MARTRQVLAALAGVIVLGGGAWLVANLSAEPISLARPARGEARPDHLPDGTPVWVIGHGDGSVDVILGFDTHKPWGLGKMLWWCGRAAALDNPHHGSKWDEYGLKLGGPAPTGLPSFDVQMEGDRLVIGGLRTAPPMRLQAPGPPAGARPWCTGLDDAVTYHQFDGWRVWDSPADAVAAAPAGWILLEGELVEDRDEGRVYVCAALGCGDRALAANVEVSSADREFFQFAGRFIAQVQDGALVGVSHVIWVEDGDR